MVSSGMKILSKFNPDISPYCNLSPEEILAKLNSINSNIINAMDFSSPKRRAGSNQNLQNNHLISNLSNLIAATRRNLMFESEKSVANFWLLRIMAIESRKPGKMFSEINKIVRSKQEQNFSELKLEASRASLLVEAGIDIQLLEKDVNSCSIIREDRAKADLLAAHYSSVNDQNECINNSTFRSLIDNKVNSLLHEIARTHHNAICNFSEVNNALKPTFHMVYGDESSNIFKIRNGLQQDTINSPVLFNIYINDILRLFGQSRTGCSLVAFVDDLIVYTTGKDTKVVQKDLQCTLNKILAYYTMWKLKVNTDKCETILFRPPISKARHKIIKNYKDFHILADLQKAKAAYFTCSRLFHSYVLSKKVKIICYQLIIRTIITYGCEIWFNVSAGIMESLRIFERRCLRACLGLYKSTESNYTKSVSNQIIYNKANIPRIYNFIVELIRGYFVKAAKISNNNLISLIPFPDDNYIRAALSNGFVLPEAFIYLDRHGLLQNKKAIPLLYHRPRRKSNKSIPISTIGSRDENLTSLTAELGYRVGEELKFCNSLNYYLRLGSFDDLGIVTDPDLKNPVKNVFYKHT
ncbi:hypothetical protein M0802_010779 [Mischocyttarus mexicanus]|nr:hypothetical protein M0802_010779 [Mischocyttarus mexicanus]